MDDDSPPTMAGPAAREPMPRAPAPPPSVPWQDQDRVMVLEQMVEAELRFDPRAAYDELRAAERSGTSVNQTQASLNEVLHYAALASRLAFFARRQSKLYEATGYEAESAALREKAQEKIPRVPLAKGDGYRVVSRADLDAWLAQNMAAEYQALERRRIDLHEFAAHAERYADVWKWRGTDVRRMSEAAQAQGDFGPSK